jgi:MOSC domain-containing protein
VSASFVDTGRVVGRVAGLWRYPVKSMAPESLPQVDVSWHGLAGDRRWAFVDERRLGTGFPWLTLRELPDLARYRPSFREPDRPDRSPVVVSTPSGDLLEVTDPALAGELRAVHAIKQDRGIYDALPVSMITTQTLAALGELVGGELAVARFRPNLLVEADGDAPFAEDTWVGSTLLVGGMRLRVDARDKRCVVVNVDPATTERDPTILRAVVRERDALLGVYGSTVQPGRVSLGDPVRIST